MYKFGKRSRERLKGVDARLVNVLNELIKIYGEHFKTDENMRSECEIIFNFHSNFIIKKYDYLVQNLIFKYF